MILTKRDAASIALALSVVMFLPGSVRAQSTVEVYPGPGVDTYKSDLYKVEVFDGSAWVPAYVYKFSRKSICHWHFGTFPSVNFVTFGTSGSIDVRVTKLSGPITQVDVSPHSKHIASSLAGGQAVETLQPNDKLWLTINGDDANPLFLFADNPKASIPPGATYFGPGVHDIAPAAGNHYKAQTGEAIYIDGGAWVRGNIDVHGTHNVRIMGPGVLSGDLWIGENIGKLPFDQWGNYSMIVGDWFGGDGTIVRDVTILDSPKYNIFGGVTDAYSVKILSPWVPATDGFQGVTHVDHSLIFNGDNAFASAIGGLQGDDVTITHCFAGTTNNSVFAGGYWGYESHKGYTALADDIDVKTYENGDWITNPEDRLAAVFQTFVDNDDPAKGYSNQTYQNIRIEGSLSAPVAVLKNLVYIWDPAHNPNPPLGNSYNFVFRNVSLEGTQKFHSEIRGWDANNAFHNVVVDNMTIDGNLVTTANLGSYFDVAHTTGAVTAYPDYLASVLPVVGSAPGSHGSYFKTSMQAYNPSTTNFPLRIVYHPAGVPGGSSDPSKQITVLAGQVLYIPDLLPVMGVASGFGSLDVYLAVGETRNLATTFRVYNDGGAAGTSGFNEDLVPLNKVFVSGATVSLTCPPDPAKLRLNVGVRTLADGATITATLRNAAGATVKTVTNTYAANYFEQKTLDAFLGGATVVGNESLTLQITAGEAIVYGATADNITNDPSVTLAHRQ